MRRPCGVVVSAHVSLSERKPALAFATASSTLSKSRVDLASRDDEQVSRLSARAPYRKNSQIFARS